MTNMQAHTLIQQIYLVKVEIVNYDPSWPELYTKEKSRIIEACGDKVHTIEHIGSTSVPGLGAKPIIDILLGVKILSDAEDIIPSMQNLGYTYKSAFEDVMPYRRYFTKPDKYHVHTVETGSPFWKRHMNFRNYLRLHDEVRDNYFKIKTDLAEKEWNDINDYAFAKTNFIRDIELKAAKYFNNE